MCLLIGLKDFSRRHDRAEDDQCSCVQHVERGVGQVQEGQWVVVECRAVATMVHWMMISDKL